MFYLLNFIISNLIFYFNIFHSDFHLQSLGRLMLYIERNKIYKKQAKQQQNTPTYISSFHFQILFRSYKPIEMMTIFVMNVHHFCKNIIWKQLLFFIT